MTTMTAPTTTEDVQALIAADLADVEVPTLTLGDLIRAGSAHTVKVECWGAGTEACALSAAAIAADSLGLL